MRMTLCGQTIAHLPHWMQMPGSQAGISSARLRFSHLAVPVIGLADRVFDRRNRFTLRQYAGEREETDLHDRVDPPAYTALARHPRAVNDEKPQPLTENLLLRRSWQAPPDLFRHVGSVEQKRPTRRESRQHVVAFEEGRLMAGDEVGPRHEVSRADRLRAETKVRDRDRARLLRVIHEIALSVIAGLLADDLDRILVGPDRAVRAQAVEQSPDHVLRLGRKLRVVSEARARQVVVNSYGEMILRPGRREFIEDRLDHRRGELFRRQAVAAADDYWHRLQLAPSVVDRFVERVDAIEVERLACAAWLFSAVEYGD